MIILHYAIEMDSFNDFRNQKYSLFSSFSDHMSDFLVKFLLSLASPIFMFVPKRGAFYYFCEFEKSKIASTNCMNSKWCSNVAASCGEV